MICTTFACSSPSAERDSLSKNRPKKCRTRVLNWEDPAVMALSLMSSAFICLCTVTDGHGDVSGHCLHILVLNQLSKDFLEGGQVHQFTKPADAVFRFDLALVDDDDFCTQPFDHFQDVRYIKDDFSA